MAGKIYITVILLLFIPFLIQSKDPAGLFETQQYFEKKILDLSENPHNLKLTPIKEYNFDEDSIRSYIEKIRRLLAYDSVILNRWQEIAAIYEIGSAYHWLHLPDSCLYYLDKVIVRIDKKENPHVYIDALRAAGYASMEAGYYIRSNEYHEEALKMPEVKDKPGRYNRILITLAENYLNLFQYTKSVEYCKTAYAECMKRKEYDDASYVLVMMYKNAYHTEKDTSYLEYLHLANEMALLSGNPGRIGNNLVNTGIAYYNEGLFGKALDYLLRGWNIDKNYSVYGDLYGSAWIAKTYAALDSTGPAYRFALRTVKRAREVNGIAWIYRAYDALAYCYEKMNMLDSARFWLIETIRLESLSGRSPNSPAYYKRLSGICLKMDDYASSIKYLDTSYMLFTKIISKSNEQELIRMRTRFDYDLQKEKISELRFKQELLRERHRRTTILFLAASFTMLVSIFFIILLFRKNKKLQHSYVAIVRKNIELDTSSGILRNIREKISNKHVSVEIRNDEELLNRITGFLENEKIYKRPDISLSTFAELLGTNTTYLSSLINSHFGMNFKRLIHKYRIDEARSILISPNYRNYSMEGIALELGYKSRSLFHQMFKDVTGVTPAAYADYFQKAREEGNTEKEESL